MPRRVPSPRGASRVSQAAFREVSFPPNPAVSSCEASTRPVARYGVRRATAPESRRLASSGRKTFPCLSCRPAGYLRVRRPRREGPSGVDPPVRLQRRGLAPPVLPRESVSTLFRVPLRFPSISPRRFYPVYLDRSLFCSLALWLSPGWFETATLPASYPAFELYPGFSPPLARRSPSPGAAVSSGTRRPLKHTTPCGTWQAFG